METDRERDRERETDRETERQREKHTHTHTHTHTQNRQAVTCTKFVGDKISLVIRQTDRQTDGQAFVY